MITITATLIIYSGSLCSQKTTRIKKYLETLPKNLKLEEKAPQKYLMTAEYFKKHIYRNFNLKVRISGEYTRGIKINMPNRITYVSPAQMTIEGLPDKILASTKRILKVERIK